MSRVALLLGLFEAGLVSCATPNTQVAYGTKVYKRRNNGVFGTTKSKIFGPRGQFVYNVRWTPKVYNSKWHSNKNHNFFPMMLKQGGPQWDAAVEQWKNVVIGTSNSPAYTRYLISRQQPVPQTLAKHKASDDAFERRRAAMRKKYASKCDLIAKNAGDKITRISQNGTANLGLASVRAGLASVRAGIQNIDAFTATVPGLDKVSPKRQGSAKGALKRVRQGTQMLDNYTPADDDFDVDVDQSCHIEDYIAMDAPKLNAHATGIVVKKSGRARRRLVTMERLLKEIRRAERLQ